MPHVESMHKSYCNDPRCYMDENPYGDYLSRWEQTKDDSCILQDEYESNKWAHEKKIFSLLKTSRLNKMLGTRGIIWGEGGG